jgi:hypothetical protein
MYQGGSHWTDFREIWYWVIVWKSVTKFRIWLKFVEQIVDHFTVRPKYALLLKATLNRHGIRLLGVISIMGTRRNITLYVGVICRYCWYGSRISGCQPDRTRISFVQVTTGVHRFQDPYITVVPGTLSCSVPYRIGRYLSVLSYCGLRTVIELSAVRYSLPSRR